MHAFVLPIKGGYSNRFPLVQIELVKFGILKTEFVFDSNMNGIIRFKYAYTNRLELTSNVL